MSLPAAAAPLAVLVLAWDEATPAVRAVVDAPGADYPAPDPVAVVVPAGPGHDEAPSQEEFLPLEAAPGLLAAAGPDLPSDLAAAPGAAAPASDPKPAAEATAAAPAAELPPAPPAELFVAASSAGLPAAASPVVASTLPLAPPPPPPAWAVVQVLRLSDFSLPRLAERAGPARPGLVWRGRPTAPAAPYLGSSEAGILALPATELPGQPPLAPLPVAAAEPAAKPAHRAVTTSGEAVAAAPVASADAATLPTVGDAPPAPAPANWPPAAAPRPALPSLLLLPAEEELPDEADVFLPEEDEPLPAPFAQAQASQPAAPSARPQPAASATAEAGLPTAEPPAALSIEPVVPITLPAGPPPAALLPPTRPFTAPDLNFQIIQYARLVVPLALAERPFGVIYAPAWPTWLAAQELRQRTGQPLVLHVSTLAAPPDDSLALATGWLAELQRQALHRADVVLAETSALAQRLRHELGLPAHRVRVVPAADAGAIAQALHTAQPLPRP